MVDGDVDHPSTEKHEGHVYISKSDVEDGENLLPGDIVNFHLYVDEKGLGAERCSLEQRAPSQFNADAAEFVPKVEKSGGHNLMSDANEVAPWYKLQLFNLRADATEFVPGGRNMGADADEFVPCSPWTKPSPINDVFARLSQVFASDDEDDEDDFAITPANTSDSDKDSLFDESGESSEDDQVIKWQPHVEAPSLKIRARVKRPSSPDGSTSAGTTSDSEGESSCDNFPILTGKPHRVCATMAKFRPPPGLSPLPNYRPPPGLSLPWEVDACEFSGVAC
jgi:hypothetical protein